MRTRRAIAVLGVAALGASIATTAVADDGERISKSMSHEGQDLTQGIEENEHAFIAYMKFYVPTQGANGIVAPVDYYDVDDALVETRDLAKPLVGVYLNGLVEGVEGEEIVDEETGGEIGFAGHGLRDAYAAVSLDDGMTWKNTNLSESADKSSSDVIRTDVPLFEGTDFYYPGDVTNIFQAVAGNNVLVAWQSRYCESGQPNFSLDNPDAEPELLARREAIATYLGIDLDTASPDDLYLIDMFGVGGNQGFVDYAEDKWPANHVVGQVPFNCLWTARGTLNEGDDPRTANVESSFMRWYKAERLTSGRRDVNRIEVMGVAGAGFAMTWQEDPDGLLPGQGEGPGAGWSGAIANSKTDVWYSYIDWEDFTVVQDPADDTGATAMTLADYEVTAAASDVTQKPKPFVPFAMPMRLTDNDKCNADNPQPYCNGSAIMADYPDLPVPMDYGLRDMCASVIELQVGRHGETTPVCVTEDGLPLLGNTAATRPRLNLYGYDSTSDKVSTTAVTDNAFAVVVMEEDKGLGKFGFVTTDGIPDYTQPCDPEEDTNCVTFDEGKNIWYTSFAMSLTDEVALAAQGKKAAVDDGLPANLAFHGNMLNEPEVNWLTGDYYGDASTDYMWDFSEAEGDAVEDYSIYNTEIARRGSLLAQDIVKVHQTTSQAKKGLIALPSWKQGVMNQGGPADVMARQIIIPKNWKLSKDGNPYAFRNMACDEWAYADGSNPQYPEGVCVAPAVNISGTVPDKCIDSTTGADVDCPTVTDGVGDTNPILQGKELGDEGSNTTKALSWHQCQSGGVYTDIAGATVTCPKDETTLDDQSWYNPLDVAKGHRGFLDGDFVMMLYAWSPNWRLNTVGHDRYELYVRRSFDGAESFTTTPKTFKSWDNLGFKGTGTTTCETFRSETTGQDAVDEPRVCTDYTAGAAEQARNVTQHQSMRITTLDPRYATTGSPYGVSVTADPFGFGVPGYTSGTGDSEDVRDPSRYFIVYETGDNTTTALGEPEPLDLFYGRAVNFGDDYVVWDDGAETSDGTRDVSECYPSNPHYDTDPDTGVPEELIDSGFCNEFDQVDQGTPGLEGSEASLQANPGGEFLYAAWAQLMVEDDELTESDAMARRIWWIDGFTSETNDWVFGQGSDTAMLLRSQEVMVLDD